MITYKLFIEIQNKICRSPSGLIARCVSSIPDFITLQLVRGDLLDIPIEDFKRDWEVVTDPHEIASIKLSILTKETLEIVAIFIETAFDDRAIPAEDSEPFVTGVRDTLKIIADEIRSIK